jgi:hypothetical protein
MQPYNALATCLYDVHGHWLVTNVEAWFPMGLDCIFRLRVLPYSLWTFHLRTKHASGLAADYPIRRDCYCTQVKTFPAIRQSPIGLSTLRL